MELLATSNNGRSSYEAFSSEPVFSILTFFPLPFPLRLVALDPAGVPSDTKITGSRTVDADAAHSTTFSSLISIFFTLPFSLTLETVDKDAEGVSSDAKFTASRPVVALDARFGRFAVTAFEVDAVRFGRVTAVDGDFEVVRDIVVKLNYESRSSMMHSNLKHACVTIVTMILYGKLLKVAKIEWIFCLI